jgi:hypothetical protein
MHLTCDFHTLRNVFYPTLVGVVGVAVFLVGFFVVQVAGATLNFVCAIFANEPVEYLHRERLLEGERKRSLCLAKLDKIIKTLVRERERVRVIV